MFIKNEFNELLAKIGIFLADQEMRIVYEAFSQDGGVTISFTEFIQSLRVIVIFLKLFSSKFLFKKFVKEMLIFGVEQHVRVQTHLYSANMGPSVM